MRYHHLGPQPPAAQPARRPPVPSTQQAVGPWSSQEHERFLDALEKYGCGQSTSVFAVWHAIAAAVGTRSLQDVKAHATWYYQQLQTVNAERRREYLAMQQVDTRWTIEEDATLEALLAQYSDGVTYPWERMAARMPGKSARDLRERYQKLCYDVARIEAGQHVTMHLGRYPRKIAPRSVAQREEDAADGDPTDTLATDCIVSLTPAEAEILLGTLQQAAVPAGISTDVLAIVASAIAALACARHRRCPPERVRPLFSSTEARRAVERVIAMALLDGREALTELAQSLGLLSHARPGGEPSHVTATAAVSFMHSPFTPSGPVVPFAFDTGSTDPEKEETRSAEELLTHLKTSPVHRSLHTRGQHRSGAAIFSMSAPSFPYSFFGSAAASPSTSCPMDNFPSVDTSRSARHGSTDELQDYGL
ncbi:hypothetical protein ATCC90586_005155 [Pythium insidiosum]|nr:hypothetical protein ATCC90586_005155 [Pythium insidiosum]